MVKHPHCQLLGIDMQTHRDRLRLLELTDKDKDACDKLHRYCIKPKAKKIVELFYDYVTSHKEFRTHVTSDDVRQRLELTFLAYLDSLGKGFESLDYVEYRLGVGVAHNRIGLSLSLYECAYRKLRQLMTDSIPEELQESLRTELYHFIQKIVALDMSLAIDSYYQHSVSGLNDMIGQLQIVGDKLKLSASIDPLTNTLNRAGIMDVLHSRIESGDKKKVESTFIAMVDIDNLGEINNQYGHLVGDHVMNRIVQRMNQVVLDEKAIIGRYGGDEFLVVLCRTDKEKALRTCRKIQEAVSKKSFKLGEEKFNVSVSQGVAQAKFKESVGSCLQRVDRYLLQAKSGDGDHISCGSQ